MVKITFVESNGTEHSCEGETGMTLMEVAIKNDTKPSVLIVVVHVLVLLAMFMFVKTGKTKQVRPMIWKKICWILPFM